VIEIFDGRRQSYSLDPTELGLPRATADAVRGGGAAENAAIARQLLEGATGARRDILLLNAAAALRAAGLAGDWREGLDLAAEAIDRGRAGETLERWVKVSQAVAVAS
jgi:anthranilate phosphoribosyltransferase